MLITCGSIVRLLRRRIVLALIFGLSLTYCAISLLSHDKMGVSKVQFDDDDNMIVDNDDVPLDDDLDDDTSGKNIPWPLIVASDDGIIDSNNQPLVNTNDTDNVTKNCRNSVQGKSLIVDERGFVCKRQELLSTGCCKNDQEKISDNGNKSLIKRERYSCETCNPQGCCAVYEYCVSCCLHPAKRRTKKDYHGLSGRHDVQKTRKIEDVVKLRLRNLDRFQICLAVCRTSSASVRHENTYKDPDSKHCYITILPSNSVNNQNNERHLISITHNNNNNDDKDVITSFSTLSLFIL
ncbi:SREBP regulating gene protein [Microplitis demolitor]|uniref:SREBP regulating gene protein n=1 Tax=Microplitis demolitor TaxID=69319 RepID=UPI0004CDB720|nr:SREBP regulating gene protein [Microplitis demolitor]